VWDFGSPQQWLWRMWFSVLKHYLVWTQPIFVCVWGGGHSPSSVTLQTMVLIHWVHQFLSGLYWSKKRRHLAACFCWCLAWFTLKLWRRRVYLPLQFKVLSELHSITTQKTELLIHMALLWLAACFMLVSCLAYTSMLKMEATFVQTRQLTFNRLHSVILQ
jgi:hypothetical protein